MADKDSLEPKEQFLERQLRLRTISSKQDLLIHLDSARKASNVVYKLAVVQAVFPSNRAFYEWHADVTKYESSDRKQIIDGVYRLALARNPKLARMLFEKKYVSPTFLERLPDNSDDTSWRIPIVSDLERLLPQRIIGQPEACQIVSKKLRGWAKGLTGEKPPGFMFYGPSGVGKTELVNVVSEVLFDQEPCKIDGSEFQSEGSMTRLTGAPPSFVGHHDPIILDQVVENPDLAILFDEAEKAIEVITGYFLGILDKPINYDAQAQMRDFRRAVFFFTTNAGYDFDVPDGRAGFGQQELSDEEIIKARLQGAKKAFRPEFLNRLTLVPFYPLNTDNMYKVLSAICAQKSRSDAYPLNGVQLTPKLRDKICEEGFDRDSGARNLERTLNDFLEEALDGFDVDKYKGKVVRFGYSNGRTKVKDILKTENA